MDLWQLHIFCKVVELQSFSKAGEAVHLSQPTVSSHIKELEIHFGAQLIDRLARRAVPTKAGELLYRQARRLIALRDETESTMAEYLGRVKGRLIIGGSTIPGSYLLPQQVGFFCHKHPQVRIALKVADTSEILDGIAEGHIEAGVVGALSDDPRLLQHILTDDRLCLVVPERHPWAKRKNIDLASLTGEPFIIREFGSGTLRVIESKLKAQGHTLNAFNIVAEMGSTEAVRHGIKNGVGLSILSAIAVADEVGAGTLATLAIDELDLTRHFYLTRHKQRTPSPICRAFMEFLLAQYGIDDGSLGLAQKPVSHLNTSP
ncbi:MAG: LysR family transcriptional regulator [Desulfatitalea sp.]|nr:LysR family transcriptional regulator [Desulfatitalea sp.]NNK00252.1 LysR family transcriptional regulator [Desulfatitalea sp.]